MAEAVGLSIGASRLAGVLLGRSAVTRQSVLTIFGHRPPEVGVPSENPRLDEPGLVISGFVERVGDPVGMVAADGSVRRGDGLVADALRALLYTVTGGQRPVDPPTVTYPAHWRGASVTALRNALTALPEWSHGAPTLISDATAAITALQTDPGVPARGVVALCDFGGTGTSITLFDAANGYRPIGPTVRHPDFCGDLIDQALLKHVIADLSTAGSVDVTGTSALGSLNRLRAQCRGAKERLSSSAATTLAADIPGFRGDIRLTRNELKDELATPLGEFVAVLQETIDRAGIRPADLVALASTGGGASIPAVTTTLSERFRVPVITTPRPQLTAATGGAIRAPRRPEDDRATAMAAAAAAVVAGAEFADADAQSTSFHALAWSEAHDVPPLAPAAAPYREAALEPRTGGLSNARPELRFEHSEGMPGAAGSRRPAWYRWPFPLAGATVVALLVLAIGAFVLLGNDAPSATTTKPLAPTPPAAPTEVAVSPPPAGDSAPDHTPPTRTVIVAPAPNTQVPAPATVEVPPPTSDAPPPSATIDTPPPTADTPPPPAAPPPRLIPTIPPIPGIPGVTLPPLIPQQPAG